MSSNNKYALIIGVGEDLPVTVRDAEALYSKLTHSEYGSYQAQNVLLLTNEKANKTTVVEHLKKMIKIAHDDQEATVIIYYSGHGGLVEKKDKTTAYYLMTYGYDDYDVEGTMLDGNTFSYLVNNIRCKKLLVLLDCCNADGMEDENSVFTGQVSTNALTGASSSEILTKLTRGQGRIFVSSCKDDQKSLVLGNSENSLFTEVILETLDGHHSDSEDAHVPVIDLIAAVLKKVPREANKIGKEQHPLLSNADDLDAHFFICPNLRNGRPATFEEKLAEIRQCQDQTGTEKIMYDIIHDVEGQVPEEIVNDVEKLIKDNQNAFRKIISFFKS